MAKSRDGYYYREGKLFCWSKMIDGKRIVIKANSHGERDTRIKKKKEDLAGGVPLDPQSVSAFFSAWLEHHVAPNRAYKTHLSYSQMLRNNIEPTLGARRIATSTSADLPACLNAMSAKGRAPRTVHYMRMVLGLVFAQAKAEGRVGLNPASSLSVPALLTKSKRVLSSDEVKRLVAYKGTRFGPLFTFLLSTGLRVSEALALTEADISGSTVVVTRQLQWRTKGAWSLTVLKTSAARRTVPLSAMAKDAIQRAKDQVARDRKAAGDGYESFDLLFATESGKPSTQSNVHRALRSALDELKIPPASVHDLRRTFLTRLARVESRPQVLKSIAGHTSLSTTMQFYVTSNAEDEASAVSRAMDGIM